MKICVDENIPLATVSELRSLGHDVLDIRGTSDQGISDDPCGRWHSARDECCLQPIRVLRSTAAKDTMVYSLCAYGSRTSQRFMTAR